MKKITPILTLFGVLCLLESPVFASDLSWIPGTSQKICQLTGDVDLELKKPTLNLTETRFGVGGTDLGFSFEHEGKLFFLFGDTTQRPDLKREVNEDNIAYADPMPTCADDCIPLHVLIDPKDGGFHPPRIPGISNGTFEVPTGGVSANHKMYVYFSSGNSDAKAMHHSYLGVSTDDGYSFTQKYLFSSLRFINVTPVKVEKKTYPELPVLTGDAADDQSVLLFGSGWYRRSNPYLSVVSEGAIDHKDKVRFFAGLDKKTQAPKWSAIEKESAPLFVSPCIGELSVTFDKLSNKWIMLYNCGGVDRGINMRLADKPWGPWSETQIIFNPVRDGAYCKFMHRGYKDIKDKCDDVSDVDQDDEWGGEYGPYMIPSLFTSNGSEETIVYTMSIHNPYQTVLMKSRFKIGGQ